MHKASFQSTLCWGDLGWEEKCGLKGVVTNGCMFCRCKTNFENMRAHGGEQVTGIYAASWGGGGASMALNEAMIAAGTRQLILAPRMTARGLLAF